MQEDFETNAGIRLGKVALAVGFFSRSSRIATRISFLVSSPFFSKTSINAATSYILAMVSSSGVTRSLGSRGEAMMEGGYCI